MKLKIKTNVYEMQNTLIIENECNLWIIKRNMVSSFQHNDMSSKDGYVSS